MLVLQKCHGFVFTGQFVVGPAAQALLGQGSLPA